MNGLPFSIDEHTTSFIKTRMTGLTKREYFVGIAMQGLLSQGNWSSDEVLCKSSIEIADELLKQLDETK
jgi:hypothetical protein